MIDTSDTVLRDLQRNSDLVYRSMSESAIRALSDYTATPLFKSISKMLLNPDQASDRLRQTVISLDRAISLFALNYDIEVFSGDKSHHYPKWETGAIYPIFKYISASLDRDLAKSFGSFLLTIEIPKGAPVLYIGENTHFLKNEYELLIRRGLPYQVEYRDEKSMRLKVIQLKQ